MARFIPQDNLWQCPKCNSFNIKGNKCPACKISYFDTVREMEKPKRKSPRKPYVPETVSESGILESFMKRKG